MVRKRLMMACQPATLRTNGWKVKVRGQTLYLDMVGHTARNWPKLSRLGDRELQPANPA
jgi:hypothetical protein